MFSLFRQADIRGLALFRVLFGLLLASEAFGALFTGWVSRTFIETNFTFTFIGFEWLGEILHGEIMLYFYGLMGILGLLIAIGYRYKLSMSLYALMWLCTYLLQKSHYNNHYYLMVLLCFLMIFLPAGNAYSVDSRLGRVKTYASIPNWVYVLLIAQVGIIYFYAAFNKLYTDWLSSDAIARILSGKANYALIGPILQEKWAQFIIAWTGIFFDGLVFVFLLWRKTRVLAFILSLFFHLLNSWIFRIGVFPYLMIAYTLLFFYEDHRLLRYLPVVKGTSAPIRNKQITGILLMAYLAVQVLLPLRHYVIEGNVFETEEGHRMAWRMMLRVKSGSLRLTVKDKLSDKSTKVRLSDYVTNKQYRALCTHPDMIYSMVQRLKKEYRAKGWDPEIYAHSRINLNGSDYWLQLDPNQDLAQVEWSHFKHNDWILLRPAH